VVGRGQIIELGGSQIFTNDRLDKLDNSVLVANMVQPGSWNPLTILETHDVDGASQGSTGEVTIGQLMSPSVRNALMLLFWAGFLWMLWHWRRLGRPVEEDPLVRVPASQLVVATGDLLELSQQHTAAAVMLRDDFRRTVADRLGIDAGIETNAFVEVVSRRTGVDAHRLRTALRAETVSTPESLVAYSQHLERLQQEVKHVR
jgi:hypothetical protein